MPPKTPPVSSGPSSASSHEYPQQPVSSYRRDMHNVIGIGLYSVSSGRCRRRWPSLRHASMFWYSADLPHGKSPSNASGPSRNSSYLVAPPHPRYWVRLDAVALSPHLALAKSATRYHYKLQTNPVVGVIDVAENEPRNQAQNHIDVQIQPSYRPCRRLLR